jgi:hypothetical protein
MKIKRIDEEGKRKKVKAKGAQPTLTEKEAQQLFRPFFTFSPLLLPF